MTSPNQTQDGGQTEKRFRVVARKYMPWTFPLT
jgi:hypothetical protein